MLDKVCLLRERKCLGSCRRNDMTKLGTPDCTNAKCSWWVERKVVVELAIKIPVEDN